MKVGNGAGILTSLQKMTKVDENLQKLSKIGFVLGLFLIVHSSWRNSQLIKRLPKLTRKNSVERLAYSGQVRHRKDGEINKLYKIGKWGVVSWVVISDSWIEKFRFKGLREVGI